MQKWEVAPKSKQQQTSQAHLLKAEVADVDYKVPILDVKYSGFEIKAALLDEGSRVNILPESICKKLGIT